MAETTYDYRDLEDRLLYQVVRRPKSNGGKTFLQRRSDGNGGWVYNLDDVERVPYKWLWVDDAREAGGATVFVVEGEKDVETLTDAGLLATTSAQGTWPWPDSWAHYFDGFETVVIIADNDPPGRETAMRRAEVISRAVSDVRVLWQLPDVGEHGDVTDWLEDGHTIEELQELVHEAPWYVPKHDPPEPTTLAIRWVRDVIAEPPPEPAELISGFLREAELAVIVAPRKIGKSWTGMQIASLLSRGPEEGGRDFLGRLAICQKAKVLIAQGELNEWGSWSRWRHLIGKDEPPELVAESFERWAVKVQTRRTTSHDPETSTSSTVEEQFARIGRRLEQTIIDNGFQVLIIDPWAVFFAGRENSNDEVEAALAELRQLTLRTGVAIIIIHHVSKAQEWKDPEDLWRGAGRLADWASTGLTMMPHFQREKDWQKAGLGLNRNTAKWYVDLFFMRRDTPTPDFHVKWDPTSGWWDEWVPQPKDEERVAALDTDLIIETLAATGGRWGSLRQAADALGRSAHTTRRYLNDAIKAGAIEECAGDRPSGHGFRIPLHIVVEQPPLDAYEGETDEPDF